MPLATGETIYVGESFVWRIPAVNVDESLLTNTNAPDSFTYEILLDGDQKATGSMVHTSPDGTWEARVASLDDAGEYHLHATATKGSSVGQFHDTLVVTAFT